MAKKSGLKTPEVHVVLDTNVLFTEAEDRLLSSEISDLIMDETRELGINITWHLPEVVRLERRHQMLDRALKLLIPLGKLEKLLGHNLNMTEDIVSRRVDEAIERHMKHHDLRELLLDYSRVDWIDLVSRSASRTPPFSPNGEKGFKDAIVLESYCQLAASLPRTSTRVILLTGDDILIEAAKKRSNTQQNGSVSDSITDLKTSLNAIAAHLPADAIATILDRATKILYQSDDKATLWYVWNLGEKFAVNGVRASRVSYRKDYKTKLRNLSPLMTSFERKEGQRVFFETEISYNLEARKTLEVQPSLNRFLLSQPQYEIGLDPITGDPVPMRNALAALGAPYNSALASSMDASPAIPSTKEFVVFGTVTFTFEWGATLTRRGSLIKPELGEIAHKSTTWSDTDPCL